MHLVCDDHGDASGGDATARVAAVTLRRLLLRPVEDTGLAEVVRRSAVQEAGHHVSGDAVRHREGRLINEVARRVSVDLASKHGAEPRSIEAAVHTLAPLMIDTRDNLHDLLCVIYGDIPPADEREARTVSNHFDLVIVQLGEVVFGASQLVKIGLRTPDLRSFEFALISLGRHLVARLFDEGDEREVVLEILADHPRADFRTNLAALRATARGTEVVERAERWIRSCYPTCAFERSTDVSYMRGPHALLTLMYDFEMVCLRVGYSNLNVPEVSPLRHHRLTEQ